MLEYLRFLALEADRPRAKDAATRLLALLNLGVEQKGRGKINITIDPNPRTEEGDYGGWEFMMALMAGASGVDKKKG